MSRQQMIYKVGEQVFSGCLATGRSPLPAQQRMGRQTQQKAHGKGWRDEARGGPFFRENSPTDSVHEL